MLLHPLTSLLTSPWAIVRRARTKVDPFSRRHCHCHAMPCHAIPFHNPALPCPALPCPAPSTTVARPHPTSHQYNARDICLSRHMHTVLPYLPSSEKFQGATSLQTNPKPSLLVDVLQGSTPTAMAPLVPVGSYPTRAGVRVAGHQTPRQGFWSSSSPSSCYPVCHRAGCPVHARRIELTCLIPLDHGTLGPSG
ncbi:hypothetical protein F5883DRAFT_140100 [Diaporthe sp. PMI_573]|nr:hypothetical protein F5883DRAFT_140100 [Diaporthaceae sp. PMI_573]